MRSLVTFITENTNVYIAKVQVVENGETIEEIKKSIFSKNLASLQYIENTILSNRVFLGKHPDILFKETIEENNGNIVHQHTYKPTVRDCIDYSYIALPYLTIEYTNEEGVVCTYEDDDFYYTDNLKEAKEALKRVKRKSSYYDWTDVHIVFQYEAYKITNVRLEDYDISDTPYEIALGSSMTEAFSNLSKKLKGQNVLKQP